MLPLPNVFGPGPWNHAAPSLSSRAMSSGHVPDVTSPLKFKVEGKSVVLDDVIAKGPLFKTCCAEGSSAELHDESRCLLYSFVFLGLTDSSEFAAHGDLVLQKILRSGSSEQDSLRSLSESEAVRVYQV